LFLPPPTTRISTLSLHDALPIFHQIENTIQICRTVQVPHQQLVAIRSSTRNTCIPVAVLEIVDNPIGEIRKRITHDGPVVIVSSDRKSTRLNSSHVKISYAVFCL